MWLFWTVTAWCGVPTTTDYLELHWIGRPRLQGDTVMFNTGGQHFDPAAKPFGDTQAGWSYEGRVQQLDLKTGSLTTIEEEGWSLATAKDGRLAYVGRDGEGGAALFVRDGEQTRRLDTPGMWPSSLTWADDTSLLFLAWAPASTAEKEAHWWAAGVREYDAPQRTTRVHRMNLEDGSVTAVTPEFLHIEGYSVSSRGEVALVTAATGRDYDAYFMARVQLLGADGTLTPISEPGCAESPSWSPDGRSLAWIGCDGGILTDQVNLYTAGQVTDILATRDETVTGLDWTERGLVIWTQQGIRTGLLRYHKGKLKDLPSPDADLGSSAVEPKGRWAVVVAKSPSHPGRLARLALDTGVLTELYDPNPEWAAFELPSTEIVTWKAADGTPLEGLLHRPPASVPTRGLFVYPHGGPNSVSALDFGNGVPQALASAGYAVFEPNFRGGVGYGRAFYEANRGHIADVPFADIEAGVDHLVSTGFDLNALFYGGWSYGGYLGAWTLGHTHRYRAIVVGGVISSRLVQYSLSSNTGRRATFIFGGSPWTHREAYDRQDPNRFLADAKTPTLLFHGADDDATPLPHAHILHRALKDLGVETKLYVYPEERHWGFEPARQKHVLDTWIAWLDAH